MKRQLLIAVTALLAFAGCTAKTQPSLPTQGASAPLEGVRWQLTGFSDHAVTVPQKAWMRLEKGRYVGFAGCNGLSGSYKLDGNKISFTMDPSTMPACPDMKGETLFRKRLLESDRFKIGSGMLKLYGGKKVLLVFLPRESEEK
ncbi:META domain-containing protein [Hydrogenimonas sp. SS33]|uniref:META domain-containing protein n=1 Tax=Hydrogenimonas leucolamina TaxID=2954236 RepID=UPI00336BCAA2